MPPSILENIQESFNYAHNDEMQGYDNEDAIYGRKQDNYREPYDPHEQQIGYHENGNNPYMTAITAGHEQQYGSTQIINHMTMRPYPNDPYLKEMVYENQQRTMVYGGSKANSPYMSKEHITGDLYSPRDSHYPPLRQGLYGEQNGHSVQSLLKTDYQVRFSQKIWQHKEVFKFFSFLISNDKPTIIPIVCPKDRTKMVITFRTLPKKITHH
jgi:cadherin EGF LAG seven-pass G-type receptor 1